jgi:hypothetical protein
MGHDTVVTVGRCLPNHHVGDQAFLNADFHLLTEHNEQMRRPSGMLVTLRVLAHGSRQPGGGPSMSLQDKLDAFKVDFEAGRPPYNVPRSVIETMHRAILYSEVNPDYTHRPEPEDMIPVLQRAAAVKV